MAGTQWWSDEILRLAVFLFHPEHRRAAADHAADAFPPAARGAGDALQRAFPRHHARGGADPLVAHGLLLDAHGDVHAGLRRHHFPQRSRARVFHRGAALGHALPAGAAAVHVHRVLLRAVDEGAVCRAGAARAAGGHGGASHPDALRCRDPRAHRPAGPIPLPVRARHSRPGAGAAAPR